MNGSVASSRIFYGCPLSLCSAYSHR